MIASRTLYPLVFLVFSLVACKADPAGTEHTSNGPSVRARVQAIRGATLKLPKATLVIPPGALSADADIVLADEGAPLLAPEEVLLPASNAFNVAAPADRAITLKSPLTLTLQVDPSATVDVADIIVAETDPADPIVTIYRFGDGLKDGEGKSRTVLGRPYTELGSRMWLTKIPKPKPVEKFVLQVPWYFQSGLPWCTPTSLTEMSRYFEFNETLDPLNATFGPTTANANWQLAGKAGQAAGSGAGWGEIELLGLKDHLTVKVWDDDFLISDTTTEFGAFQAYVTLATTGFFGAFERKPLMLSVDLWWHSLMIVGVDNTNVYLHDSNHHIAKPFDWLAFHNLAHGMRTDAASKEVPDPKPKYRHTFATGVAQGLPVKPETQRRGSVVLSRGDLSFQMRGRLGVVWDWDGKAPHTDGYFFSGGLPDMEGRLARRSLPMHFKYRIANVTDVELTFKTVAEVSGPDYGTAPASLLQTVTVPPYSLSGYLEGDLPNPPTGDKAFFAVKLYRTDAPSQLQDVKFVSYGVENSEAPTIQIEAPTAGATVIVFMEFAVSASSYDPDTALPLPGSSIAWSVDGTPVTPVDGKISVGTVGMHTITATGTGAGGLTASHSITVNASQL